MDALKESLIQLIKKNAYQVLTVRATVVSYDKAERTCKVILDNGTEIEDVLIQPISSYDKGIVIYPGVDSKVILEKIESQDMALKISSYTEIAEIEIDIDQFSVKWDKTGLKVENQGEDLKTILNDHFDNVKDHVDKMKAFMDECNKIVVVVGNTINVGAVSAIKAQVSQLQSADQVIKDRLNKIIC